MRLADVAHLRPELRSDVVLPLDAEQQRIIRERAGVRKPAVTVPRMLLVAYALAAKARGSTVLAIASTPARQAEMLGETDETSSLTIPLPMTAEQRALVRDITGVDLSVMKVNAEDFRVGYYEDWEAVHQVTRLAGGLVIAPSDLDFTFGTDDTVIRLPWHGAAAAQGVFGTGAHPATQLALQLLRRAIHPGDEVLDLGTGSGVLAIAAARLGAGAVLALDIEPAAVDAARDAVRLNSVDGIVNVERGSADKASPPYDLLLANIYANVLIPLAQELAAAVRPGGEIILSGIAAPLTEAVRTAYLAHGLTLVEEDRLEDWCALRFRRVGSSGREKGDAR